VTEKPTNAPGNAPGIHPDDRAHGWLKPGFTEPERDRRPAGEPATENPFGAFKTRYKFRKIVEGYDDAKLAVEMRNPLANVAARELMLVEAIARLLERGVPKTFNECRVEDGPALIVDDELEKSPEGIAKRGPWVP
jgi:hypothetical protein